MPVNNRNLRITLIISAIVHVSIVFIPHLNFLPSMSQLKEVELTYLKNEPEKSIALKEKSEMRTIRPREKQLVKRNINLQPATPQWKEPDYKFSANRPLSPLGKILKKYDELLKFKPQLSKPDVIAVKKKIALTPLELNKITSPSYISYYQIVREKIKRCAYQNYTSQDTGEVYISFVISASGNLIKSMIVDEKSTSKAYLKKIALKSLEDAAGFPAFPKDLDYPELTFNVIISFEIE